MREREQDSKREPDHMRIQMTSSLMIYLDTDKRRTDTNITKNSGRSKKRTQIEA